MPRPTLHRCPMHAMLLVTAALVVPAAAGAQQSVAPNGFRPAPLHPATNALPPRDPKPSPEFRQRFLAASHNRDRLTLAEAQQAGLMQVARNFSAIDTKHRGSITIEDLRNYLAAHPDDPIPRDEGNL